MMAGAHAPDRELRQKLAERYGEYSGEFLQDIETHVRLSACFELCDVRPVNAHAVSKLQLSHRLLVS